LLAGQGKADDRGLAFAETDDYEMLADGSLRFLCEKRAAACSVYDVGADPLEHVDLTTQRAADAERMRGILAAVGHQHGRFEGQGASNLPEALRRGMQGDVAAAPEVAALLDDANVEVRRKASQTLFDLRSKDVVAQLERATHDDDEEVRRWTALALARSGGPVLPVVATLLVDPEPRWSRSAALAAAERGDARGSETLIAWLRATDTPFARAREIVAALATVKARNAVPALVERLEDLRLRAYVADALGTIGDPAAKAPLLARFSDERYVTTRPHEARALALLGARGELREPLARFAGLSEPMEGAVAVALAAGLLDAEHGGALGARGAVRVPKGTLRALVLLAKPSEANLHLRVDGVDLAVPSGAGTERFVELGPREAGTMHLEAESGEGVVALWIVPRTDELAPAP
jgi:HEAT repeat protein